MALDPKKLTKEEMQRALELLEREKIRKEKIARGEIKTYTKKWSEMTEEQKEKARQAARRRNARIKLICDKAIAAGITVSDEEIDAYLKSRA